MWMLKGSGNPVLAQGTLQSVRGPGRTRKNAERAVTGGSTRGFEKGHVLIPTAPHTHLADTLECWQMRHSSLGHPGEAI